MEAEEKRQVYTPPLRMYNRRKVVVRWVFILAITAIIYRVGVALHAWANIFPAVPFLRIAFSLLISWVIGFFLLAVYGVVMSRLLVKSYIDGMKDIQAENYEAALEAFKQQYDFFDRHPGRRSLYTILLLDPSKYGHREIALLNQAHVYAKLGNGPEAIRCYEECLALNPGNELAISSLNLAAAVSGGEIRPMSGHIPYRAYAFKLPFGPWWQGCLSSIIGMSLATCCSVPTFFVLVSLGGFWNDEDYLISIIGTVVFVLLAFRVVNWIIARLVLMDFYRGERLLRKGQYREAIRAFQDQATFFQENPWVDEWRWLFLPKSGAYSYQEWALLRMAYGYVQLGEGDQLLSLYEQVLALNPDNGLAKSNINFINLFQDQDA